ncbi:MAG: LacI family DNA-binding transcriptional regulator [Tepidisphaeraceae bacterium]
MSITQVAKLANVPYVTAWRVINKQPVGSREAVEAVQAAMKHVRYVPGASRRGRPPKSADGIRTHNVALLHLREGTAISSEVLAAVQKRLSERNLNLIFAQVNDVDALPQAVKSCNVDGILGYGVFPDKAVTASLRRIPAVWLMSRNDGIPDVWGDRVRPDHVAIGRLAGNYLLDRGHKRVAYLNPSPGMTIYDERGDCFRKAVEGKVHSFTVLSGERRKADTAETVWIDAAAESLAAQWLAQTPRPTGVFCPFDRLTTRVYACLMRAGIQPGRDLQLVSCDNQADLLAMLPSRPASVDLNRNTVARLAVDRLFWRMRNGMASPAVVVTVSPTLTANDAEPWTQTLTD